MAEESAAEAFSRRLNQACDRSPHVPPHNKGRQEALRRKMKVSQEAARKWLSGEGIPRHYRVKEMASWLGVSASWLQYGEGVMVPGLNNVCPADKPENAVPLISWVQAGEFCEAVDTLEPGDALDWIASSKSVSSNAFALRISGDSMTNPYGQPSLHEGMLIVVDPQIPADPGRIVVARRANDEVTVKQLVKDMSRFYLKPLNPQYPTVEMTEEFTVCGVVVEGVVRL